ncbi:MAG: two-component sensor histidine kinase, partial [Armatimonadota bacterium]
MGAGMKLWNRLEVRLALLMAAVAVATNLITFGLTAYQGQKEFRYLPASVRAVLQDPDAVLLPFELSEEINRQLLNADQVIVQLAPNVAQGERVVMLRALEGGNVLIAQQFTLRAPVPGVSRREAGFLARL